MPFLITVDALDPAVGIFYNQIQYQRVGIDVSWYGIIFMVLQFVSLSTGASGKIMKYLTRNNWTSILFILSSISCFLLINEQGIIGTICLLAICTMTESFFYPLFSIYQNESVHIAHKATMLSIYSMIMNFIMMGTQSLFGAAVNHSLQMFYLIGGCLCLIGFVMFRIYIKDENKENESFE